MAEESGSLLAPELVKQLKTAIRNDIRNSSIGVEAPLPQSRRLPSRFPHKAVILDEDLDAASFLDEPSGSLDPTEPNATVCEWSATDKKYVQTIKRLAVANHSSTDHETDTPGAAFFIDGHYWFFGDCDPMDDRPTPPWEA